jgi:putative oxidoreductase
MVFRVRLGRYGRRAAGALGRPWADPPTIPGPTPPKGRQRILSRMNLTLTHRNKDQKEAAVITATRLTAREARPRRLTSTLLLAAQILLAAFFLFGAAVPKLTGSHSAVQEFGLIGAGQWLRYLVGTAELAGAIGLLTPWLAGLAAVGLAADMAGATIINATVLRNTTYGGNVSMTALLCVASVLLAYGRRQQIKDRAAAVRRITRGRSRRGGRVAVSLRRRSR